MRPPHPPAPDIESGASGASEADARAELLARHDVLLVRAPNPGALTLSGTNTWLLGHEPTWVVDPGPQLEDHLRSLFAAIEARGGLGGVLLTHDHRDHSEALGALVAAHPAPV